MIYDCDLEKILSSIAHDLDYNSYQVRNMDNLLLDLRVRIKHLEAMQNAPPGPSGEMKEENVKKLKDLEEQLKKIENVTVADLYTQIKILKDLIDEKIEKLEDYDVTIDRTATDLNIKIKALEKQIDKLEHDDILVLQDAKITALENKTKVLEAEIENLSEEYDDLLLEQVNKVKELEDKCQKFSELEAKIAALEDRCCKYDNLNNIVDHKLVRLGLTVNNAAKVGQMVLYNTNNNSNPIYRVGKINAILKNDRIHVIFDAVLNKSGGTAKAELKKVLPLDQVHLEIPESELYTKNDRVIYNDDEYDISNLFSGRFAMITNKSNTNDTYIVLEDKLDLILA